MRVSGALIWGWRGKASASASRQSRTSEEGRSFVSSSQNPHSSKTSETFALVENQRGEVSLHRKAATLSGRGGKPGQGYPAILTLSSEDSRARTSPSPEGETGSAETDPSSSGSSIGSLRLFAPQRSWSKMSPDCSLADLAKTLRRSSGPSPNAGMAWHGGCWIASTLEYPSGADVSTSSGLTLADLVEPNAPEKYSLSKKACRGILARVEKRGSGMDPELKALLEKMASSPST